MKKILKCTLRFCSSLNLTITVLSIFVIFFIVQAAGNKLISVSVLNSSKLLKVLVAVDMYHSWWFILLLALFSLNLIACCINRVPRTLAFLKESLGEPDDRKIDGSPVVKKFTIKGGGVESREKLRTLLSSHFSKIKMIDCGGNQLCLFTEKGKYAHVGFYFAHLSILAMVLGVMLSTGGYECSFDIAQGEIVDPLIAQDSKGGSKTFDFSILCEEFATIYYQGTPEVMKHQSTLTIIKNGERIKTQQVDFANPLVYSGIDIYQDRFSRKIKYAKIKVVSKNGEVHFHEVKKNGGQFELDHSGIIITAWKIKSRANSIELTNNLSSTKLLISTTPVSFSDQRLANYQFSLMEILEKDATSLKIIKDPGKGIVWYSFLAMVLGFSITFFFFHQRVWARVEEKGGECTITLGGAANKNLKVIKELFDTIQNGFSEVRV